MGVRPERVAKEMKRFVSEVIQRELKDPRIGFVTITDVEITRDLKLARIYFTILGNRTQKNNTINALKSATGYIRKLVGDHLELRYVPEIVFMEDLTEEQARNVHRILEEIKKEREDEHKEDKRGAREE